MIISASRRTDIPAFYSDWFMHRVREGFCEVPNPFNSRQISEVSLKPEDVDVIVFWSKNPEPMLKYLSELEGIGLRYYFQYTINNYPRYLEPKLPEVKARIATFLELSRKLGEKRVIWRYDPIIISDKTGYEFHREMFSAIAEELQTYTRRVVVSIVDYYAKTERRLADLEHKERIRFDREAVGSEDMRKLLKYMADKAMETGMEIASCAEEGNCQDIGIKHGSCIDAKLVNDIWEWDISTKKDKYQRDACLCAASKDIGINDTCIHGCPYCYSTRDLDYARDRYKQHRLLYSKSPALLGETESSDRVYLNKDSRKGSTKKKKPDHPQLPGFEVS